MATDNNKATKELLEIINKKVGMIEMRQSLQSTQLALIKDHQSVMNDKIDEIKTHLNMPLMSDIPEV